MLAIKDIKKILEKNRKLLEEKYKIKKIGVFGSFIRKEANKKSDIDILVDFFETPDLFEFIELENFLRKLLKIKVDLATKEALKPLIKKEILRETIYI
ncbi:nucleotidyltransferase family protein [Patescibacteria group bacterium]|nr:nucleotidyltransferase family protein [Patescibacteria group bacterium]MBU4480883.1 nucleotidyltransferase family protein [Patescibacteria group bacterium]